MGIVLFRILFILHHECLSNYAINSKENNKTMFHITVLLFFHQWHFSPEHFLNLFHHTNTFKGKRSKPTLDVFRRYLFKED